MDLITALKWIAEIDRMLDKLVSLDTDIHIAVITPNGIAVTSLSTLRDLNKQLKQKFLDWYISDSNDNTDVVQELVMLFSLVANMRRL
jgi:hypothetical protein